MLWKPRVKRCVFVVAAALVVGASPAGAASSSLGDADDVPLRLDIKTVSHANDGSTVYLATETYEPFSDQDAAFKWRIDVNGDGVFEVNAFAEWDLGAMVGGVEAGGGDVILSSATVSRPAPNVILLSFPASVFGGASSYSYVAIAEDDVNQDGETEPGEFDRAPDVGVIQHVLAAGAPQVSAAAGPAGPAVLPAKARTADPAIPHTGSNLALFGTIGAVVAALGLRLVAVARRRDEGAGEAA
jgi:hypothetical protein